MKFATPQIFRYLILAVLFGLLLTMIFSVKARFGSHAGVPHGGHSLSHGIMDGGAGSIVNKKKRGDTDKD